MALSAFSWEVQSLRAALPKSLYTYLHIALGDIAVPHNVVAKIAERHPDDVKFVDRLGEFLAAWEYAGLSPKGKNRLEVCGRLDSIWVIAVLQLADEENGLSINMLATMHRVYARKVLSRVRKGQLKQREKQSSPERE